MITVSSLVLHRREALSTILRMNKRNRSSLKLTKQIKTQNLARFKMKRLRATSSW